MICSSQILNFKLRNMIHRLSWSGKVPNLHFRKTFYVANLLPGNLSNYVPSGVSFVACVPTLLKHGAGIRLKMKMDFFAKQ